MTIQALNTPALADQPSTGNSTSSMIDLSPPAQWSAPAVRLLQGVIYHDDPGEAWETLLRYQSPVSEFFCKLGLQLIIDHSDGMAYLNQPTEEQLPLEFAGVPRLFRRTPLGYDATLLSVLLRDLLRQFEEEDFQNERCVVAQHELLELWQAFFPESSDELKLLRTLLSALRKLEDLKFVRQVDSDPANWEIRRIIKARLPLEDLERLRQSLVDAVAHHA